MSISESIFLMVFSGYQLTDKTHPTISQTHYPRYVWFLRLCLIIICAVTVAYLAFISIIMVCVGLTHSTESASWVPVLAGSVCLTTILLVFLIIVKYVYRSMKEEDIVNV